LKVHSGFLLDIAGVPAIGIRPLHAAHTSPVLAVGQLL